MYGRSKISNSRTPSGPNFDTDGASICTLPSCSICISSPSLKSWLFGYTSTLTLPWVRDSASSLNLSEPLPFGVFSATTWLNLMTTGCCACAMPNPSASAVTARNRRHFMKTSFARSIAFPDTIAPYAASHGGAHGIEREARGHGSRRAGPRHCHHRRHVPERDLASAAARKLCDLVDRLVSGRQLGLRRWRRARNRHDAAGWHAIQDRRIPARRGAAQPSHRVDRLRGRALGRDRHATRRLRGSPARRRGFGAARDDAQLGEPRHSPVRHRLRADRGEAGGTRRKGAACAGLKLLSSRVFLPGKRWGKRTIPRGRCASSFRPRRPEEPTSWRASWRSISRRHSRSRSSSRTSLAPAT